MKGIMPKIKITCNHCGKSVKWYKSMINEVGYVQFENKTYCECCLKLLAHIAIDL
jgi:hypothetical protein